MTNFRQDNEIKESHIVDAEIINILVKIANDLDLGGDSKAADIIDVALNKILKKKKVGK